VSIFHLVLRKQGAGSDAVRRKTGRHHRGGGVKQEGSEKKKSPGRQGGQEEVKEDSHGRRNPIKGGIGLFSTRGGGVLNRVRKRRCLLEGVQKWTDLQEGKKGVLVSPSTTESTRRLDFWV